MIPLNIKLSKDIELEISLEKTAKTVGTASKFELWADIPLDLKILEKIIRNGINSLSLEDLQKLHNNYDKAYDI